MEFLHNLQPIGPNSEKAESASILEMQILSDLHIEMLPQRQFTFEPRADYLALLGDIGSPKKPNYETFLLEQAQHFKQVFVIAGNHEFYGSSYDETRNQIETICQRHPSLIFLDRKSVVINGVRIIGATLWTRVPKQNRKNVENTWNDYSQIGIKEEGKKRKITARDTHKWFKLESKFIQNEIREAHENKQSAIVLTHHSPIKNIPGASTDMTELFNYPLISWCYGHTHLSSNLILKNVRVISNQLGYEYCMGQKDAAFRTEFILKVDGKHIVSTYIADSRVKKQIEEEKKTTEELNNFLHEQKKSPNVPPPPPLMNIKKI